MSTPVLVGRVAKSFGHEGEVTINLYDTFPENIDKEEPLLVRIDSLTVPLFLDKFQRRGRAGALVQFADFDTPERVAELIGLELYMRSGKESKSKDSNDDIYLEDLVGYTAIFDGHDITGTIDSFIEQDHNPLFAITVEGKEAYIPAADDFIVEFNTKTRTVTFQLPEGLLDLYL